jgi:hypothetical protein
LGDPANNSFSICPDFGALSEKLLLSELFKMVHARICNPSVNESDAAHGDEWVKGKFAISNIM